ncbi:hypothetical protein EGH24_06760 [Halonotius terrestris]|uniref:Uncharacterized protein n=1 Tax=Halonotius terrestris TaxID=2487750 RepID=A0A8J8P8B0_9EURY|nr:hypothetical protein [Halonotius terrestris]TQQ80854.1 hypothetical protein EGH24_06760 [Halonotius terrestris]
MDGRRLIEALLGVYVATLLIPTLAVAGWVAVASASLGTVLAVGLAIVGAVALAATAIPDLPDRVTSLPVVAATTLPPLLFLPYMFLSEPAAAPDVYPVVGLLAVVPGGLVSAAGATLKTRRLRERATEHIVVTTGDDDDDTGISHGIKVAGVVVVSLIVVAIMASLVLFDGFDGNTTLFTSLTGLSSLFFLLDDDGHELAVTDEVLRVDRSITPWDDFDGYRVTDDEIEIDRSRWYRPTRTFDRDEIGDDEAFIEALAEYLPNLAAADDVELTATE